MTKLPWTKIPSIYPEIQLWGMREGNYSFLVALNSDGDFSISYKELEGEKAIFFDHESEITTLEDAKAACERRCAALMKQKAN